jgi:hypothetical protein
MNYLPLSLFLLLSLNIFYLNSMEKDSNASNSESKTFILDGLEISEKVLVKFAKLINLSIIEAAKNCDLDTLRRYLDTIYVNENVNFVSDDNQSLLSISIQNQNHPDFTKVVDYLLSKGAQADKRANEFETNSALVISVISAIRDNKFIALNYFLEKNANPFLRKQTKTGNSPALCAVTAIKLNEQQQTNKEKVIKLFTDRACNLYEALETFDLSTIKKFARPDTVNKVSECNLLPLLQVAETGVYSNAIFQELFKHGASVNKAGIGTLDNEQVVPLQYVTINSIEIADISFISMFLEQGADPDLDPNRNNSSAYKIAQRYAHRCADPNCKLNNIDETKKIRASKIIKLFDAHKEKQKAQEIEKLFFRSLEF